MARKESNPDPSYIVRALSADDGGGFLCEVLDNPGCYGDGPTREAAIADAQLAIKAAQALNSSSRHHPAQRLR